MPGSGVGAPHSAPMVSRGGNNVTNYGLNYSLRVAGVVCAFGRRNSFLSSRGAS